MCFRPSLTSSQVTSLVRDCVQRRLSSSTNWTSINLTVTYWRPLPKRRVFTQSSVALPVRSADFPVDRSSRAQAVSTTHTRVNVHATAVNTLSGDNYRVRRHEQGSGLTEPTKQPRTTTLDGDRLEQYPDGVIFRDLTTHADLRGSVIELFNPNWEWHPEPLRHSYVFTIRPGMAKGWGMHKRASDRYAMLLGEMLTVLYDGREGSPTQGMVAEVTLSEHRRRLMAIPPGVWHANVNLGSKDAVIINFKTEPYDHDDPDKYLRPLDSDDIPYEFKMGVRGW